MDVVFYLLTAVKHQDELGQFVEEVSRREVFGNLSSVTSSEFFAGGQNGYKPEFRIIMFAYDYFGEENLVFNGETYSIYRKYLNGDKIELYCEKRAGDETR